MKGAFLARAGAQADVPGLATYKKRAEALPLLGLVRLSNVPTRYWIFEWEIPHRLVGKTDLDPQSYTGRKRLS